jgi:Dual OB-containing domain
MIKRFVCLANSKKEGGRCLAGIELNDKNRAKIEAGRPKWIRPICKTQHGEVPEYLIRHIGILDVVEVDTTDYPLEKSFQSENVYFRQKTINVIGQFSADEISPLCSGENLIFRNPGKTLSEQEIADLDYSIVLIKTNKFEIHKMIFEGKHGLRLVFTHCGNEYDLPVTDVAFIIQYKADPDYLMDVHGLFLILSLGVKFNDLYYKLVAGIIPR